MSRICLTPSGGVLTVGDVKTKKGEKTRSNSPAVCQETFSDGSRLSELADGAFILQETSHAVQPCVEQPAPYNQPPPKPKLKTEL